MEPASPTGSTGPVEWDPRRGWRGRRVRNEPYRYLLDSRLFRRLCLSGPTDGLGSFRASLARHGLSPEGGLPPLELTPFAFLDAVGIDPPHYDQFPLPASVTRKGAESLLITSLVVRMAKDFFEKVPELQVESLRKRVEELRQTVDPAAHELFDLCLTRFVSREGFEQTLLGHLAFDYLCRFRFPEVLREQLFDFLAASLFAAGESVSGLSKARIVKALWDRSYERLLKKNPGARAEVQALDREMAPRTFRDYLDWEVVHYAILGFAREPGEAVTAFTPDPEETVKARVSAYKTALRAFLDQIDREELATTLQPKLAAWKPGVLVPCRQDGTFDALIPTGGLPVF